VSAADEYARCTAALATGGVDQPGAEGRFDQALTNGLAAIVEKRWPGEQLESNNRVKSARALMGVIERKAGSGCVALEDIEPRLDDSFCEPGPTPTAVDLETLRDGLDATQPARHGRGKGRLEEKHVKALAALNDDAALRGDLSELDLDAFEMEVALADSTEQARARRYLEMLTDEEVQRRQRLDYREDYAELIDKEGWLDPAECPVCGLEALVVDGWDDYVGEFPFGVCAHCSYVRSRNAADEDGKYEAIQRAMQRDD
jgi:hypothetical protein